MKPALPMKRLGHLILPLLLLLSAGCSGDDGASQGTPTPFPGPTAVARLAAEEPIAIALPYLAANPEFFEGSTLQLSGQYQRLPRLICERDAHPGPATWAIIDESLQANAAGYDAQLRSLLAEGQAVSAEGRWLHYRGPVGCGKRARVQDVWYLSVDRILAPNPLARATSTPAAVAALPTTAGQLFESPTPEAGAPVTATVTLTPGQPLASATLALPETLTFTPLPTLGTPATLTETLATAPVPAQTVTVAPVGTLSTGTPAIGPEGTPTSTGSPAATTGTGTPSPSATGSPQSVVEQGMLDLEDLQFERLDSGAIHSWELDVESSETYTITVAPVGTADIVFSLWDEDGNAIIEQQDQAGGGEVETVPNQALDQPGIYQVRVQADPPAETDYAIMLMDSQSYSFIFKGTLTTGVARNDALVADNDHFWFFTAASGESVTLEIAPGGQEDPYVELYGPGGSRLITMDNSGDGEAERLDGYTLLEQGPYAVRVGEFDFAAMSYRITLNRP